MELVPNAGRNINIENGQRYMRRSNYIFVKGHIFRVLKLNEQIRKLVREQGLRRQGKNEKVINRCYRSFPWQRACLAVKQAKEIETWRHLSQIVRYPNCRAGVADAFILAPDTSADVRIVATATSQFTERRIQEYDYRNPHGSRSWAVGSHRKGRRFWVR